MATTLSKFRRTAAIASPLYRTLVRAPSLSFRASAFDVKALQPRRSSSGCTHTDRFPVRMKQRARFSVIKRKISWSTGTVATIPRTVESGMSARRRQRKRNDFSKGRTPLRVASVRTCISSTKAAALAIFGRISSVVTVPSRSKQNAVSGGIRLLLIGVQPEDKDMLGRLFPIAQPDGKKRLRTDGLIVAESIPEQRLVLRHAAVHGVVVVGELLRKVLLKSQTALQANRLANVNDAAAIRQRRNFGEDLAHVIVIQEREQSGDNHKVERRRYRQRLGNYILRGEMLNAMCGARQAGRVELLLSR